MTAFENRELRKIFGPKGDDIRQDWRRLQKEEFYDQYSSLSIIRAIEKECDGWGCGKYRERRGAHGVLVKTPEGKSPLGRPMCRRDNIKMDLKEVRMCCMD